MKWIIALLAFMLSGWAPAQSADLVNRIVALVGDDIITLNELEKLTGPEEERMTKMYRGPQLKEELLSLKTKYLDSLITEKLLQKEIDRQGIQLPEEDIDKRIGEWREQNGLSEEEMKTWLERQGLTLEKYRDMLRTKTKVQILLNRIEKHVVVSQDEIEKYYEQHKSDFVRKNRVHLKNIWIRANTGNGDNDSYENNKRRAQDVLDRIHGGASFEMMAIQHSEGPNALSGGDASWIDWELLDPKLQQVLDSMKDGDVSPLLEVERGSEDWFQIVLMVEHEMPGESTLEEAKDKIARILTDEKRNAEKEEWLKKLREKYFVKIML
ncbi:MAG: SurA N-terminal domain-containing protein [Deltaproteobacteria bacterium]|nr:SurA N-terminal domain-containing protein [Deltaproteobacteria bacterium]